MSIDVQKDRQGQADPAADDADQPRPSLTERLRIAFSEVNWRLTLLTALGMAVLWCALFLSFDWPQVIAGIVPVTAGLFIGRRAKGHYLTHGLLVGVIGFVIGIGITYAYGVLGEAGVVPLPQPVDESGEVLLNLTALQLVTVYLSFSAVAMIPFPAFGSVMSGRSEQRQQEMRRAVEERGGQLEKPNSVRTLEDLQGLSLPQFGTYVRQLFQKHGFTFDDYRFLNKDKHLDLELTYEDKPYLLRLSVADKVRPGTIETLAQDMKKRDVPKGLVITSTEFTPDAQKSGRNRPNIVLIDGETLYEISDRR